MRTLIVYLSYLSYQIFQDFIIFFLNLLHFYKACRDIIVSNKLYILVFISIYVIKKELIHAMQSNGPLKTSRLLQSPSAVRSMAIFDGLRFEVVDSKDNLTIKRYHRSVGYSSPFLTHSSHDHSILFSCLSQKQGMLIAFILPSRHIRGSGLRPYLDTWELYAAIGGSEAS